MATDFLRELFAQSPVSGGAPSPTSASPRALLYLTSDWAAPADAQLQPHLHGAAADVRVVVLRQHLIEDEGVGTTSLASNVVERSVPNEYVPPLFSGARSTRMHGINVLTTLPSTFCALCKRFGVTTLPACVVVDTSQEPVAKAPMTGGSLSASVTALLSRTAALRTLESATEASIGETALAVMRDDATQRFESGDMLAAAQGFVRVLLAQRACPKASFNLAVILQMTGATYFAVHFMLQVIAADDNDSVAHTVLRTVYYKEEPEAVLAGYSAIIAASPHHVRAVHSLATLRGDATTAAPAYVQRVFDDLAETFEEKLVTHLDYRVPWLLVDALKRVEPQVFAEPTSAGDNARVRTWTVADVGCGTGLCGRLLRPFVAHITGVDISPLMVEKTRASGSYDELQTDDIGPFLLKREDASLDLVISADVWIYVGALDEIFRLCARKLASGGWLAFSTELLEDGGTSKSNGVQLASSGRFQHSDAYIQVLAAAHGFAIKLQDAVSVRKESGTAIPGRIYLLQKQH